MNLPTSGRVLAIDLGTVRIGIAASDLTRTLASPRAVLPRTPDLHKRIVRVVADEEATIVVVGLPKDLRGREAQAATSARAEAEALATVLAPNGVPVVLVDERMTSAAAHVGLAAAGHNTRQRRSTIDAAAAAVLLQSFLDGGCRGVAVVSP